MNNSAHRVEQPAALDEHAAAHVAELFSVFSDTSRVRLISVLVEGEQNVGTLAKLINLSESAVSHHLRVLRQMRLVQARRDGRQVFYSLDPHVAELFHQGLDHLRNGQV
ncbi:MAG TPA: metalloregulator ArsR/SmtB family transcription factor [Anaerolineae bacterium]|nr:metalloregulator ArsR/SmtB family transcription factor [Anaerolineae bacterium]